MKDILKIAICGLGYVGLPLAIRFANVETRVLGIDIDEEKVLKLNQGESFIKHISNSSIKKLRDKKLFEATTDFEKIKEVQAIIICVPTPLGSHNEPDISYVLETAEQIAPYLITNNGEIPKLVVLESTTYPGTTEGDLKDILENVSGLKAGSDFHLAYSPEREDPGRIDHSVKTIPKVMGGYTENCLKRCVELYSMALDSIYPVSNTRVAEATKLTENIFRAVNIALVNELKILYQEMDIDVWDVIDAAATKPFGYMPFYPGPGLGGHCIPIDPFYLTWKAKEYNKHTRFIELAGEINTKMPNYVVKNIVNVLNNFHKPVNGSNVLILGLAYKPNVDDYRESPSFVIMNILNNMGAIVSYNDPNIIEINESRHFDHFKGKKSKNINDDEYDVIVLVTNHDEYKEFDFKKYKTPIIDTRNCIVSKPANYYKA